MTKLLLMIMAVFEAPVGILLLLLPNFTVSHLLGAPLDTPAGLAAGRLAGAAIFSLAIACWQSRDGEARGAAPGIVTAMTFYNQAAGIILVYASIRLGLQSNFIWPAFVLHQLLATWCFANLWLRRDRLAKA